MENNEQFPEVFLKLAPVWAALWSSFAGERAALALEAVLESGRPAESFAARKAEARVSANLPAASGEVMLQSLSHAKLRGGAAVIALGVVAKDGKIRRVGVDLERADRPVSDRVADRFIAEQERKWLKNGILQPLDFWVLKEAAFKATPSNEGAMMPDYVLKSWDPSSNQGGEGTMTSSGLQSQGLEVRVKLISERMSKFAFAYSRESLD